jgi:hypothetical protein
MKMALNKHANAQTPKFENPDDDTVIDGGVDTDTDVSVDIKAQAQSRLAAGAAAHAATKPAEEAAASTSTALTTPTGGQVAKAKPMVNPLETLKDAFPLEFDTLRQLVMTNGNITDKATGRVLGAAMAVEILTFQDQWVVSPGTEGDDGKEDVRYSNDGKTTTKGEDVATYLAQLKSSGYPKANVSERVVLGLAIVELSAKGKKEMPDLEGTLAQISLPPTSKATFKRYQMDQAYKIGRGFVEAQGAQTVRIDCDVAKRGDMSWTVADFKRYEGNLN